MCDFEGTLWAEFGVFLFFLVPAAIRFSQAKRGGDRLKVWSISRIFALIFSSVVVLTLFSARPVDLADPPAKGSVQMAAADGLVQIELKKANDEIQYRIQQEDTWFHYKFLLVGAVLAGFFTRLKKPLMEVVGSTTTCFVLALACIVALAIDIHLRNNIVVIQQLALWIKYYAEPSLAQTAGAGFVAWEDFLRTGDAGMHSDEVYGFLFYPHLHLLTWILYLLYLSSFQWLSVRTRVEVISRDEDVLLGSGFLCVHFVLAAFAFVGHFVPGTLTMEAIPFTDCPRTGKEAAYFFLLAALVLVAINSPYLVRFLAPVRFRRSK